MIIAGFLLLAGEQVESASDLAPSDAVIRAGARISICSSDDFEERQLRSQPNTRRDWSV